MSFEGLDLLGIVCFLVGGLAFPLGPPGLFALFLAWRMGRNCEREMARRIFARVLVGLMLLSALGVGGALLVRGRLAGKLRADLREVVGGDAGEAEVFVNGLPATRPAELLGALAGIATGPGHGSRCSERFPVLVRSGKRLFNLELARDAEVLDEYRVFLPGYLLIRQSEIGRIRTAALFDDVP